MEPYGEDYVGYYANTTRIVPPKYSERIAFERQTYGGLHFHPNPLQNPPRQYFGIYRIAPQVYSDDDGIVATTPSPAVKFPGFGGLNPPMARHTRPSRIPIKKQYPIVFQQ